jgi:hypothetical protein
MTRTTARRASQVWPHIYWQRRTTTSTAKMEFQNSHVGKRDVGPTCGFVASPELGPEVTVGTLQTGYPRVQASSQDKG